jgi:transposase-like protein
MNSQEQEVEVKYCPECGQSDLHLTGVIWCGRKRLQRYHCQTCGRQTCYPLTERPVETAKK